MSAQVKRPWLSRTAPRASGFSRANFSSQRPSSKPGRFQGSQPMSSPKISRVSSCEVGGGGDGDDGVGVHVVDVVARDVGVERGVDRGGAGVEAEGGVGEVADHLVLVVGAAVEGFEGFELRHVEGGEAVELHRADVAAGALDPEDFDGFAGERVGLGDLGGGVAAAIVGDALVAAEEVGAVEEEFGLAHAGGAGVVPAALQSTGACVLRHCRSSPLYGLS